MEPDPNAPPFEWARDGIASLWLIALILALVLCIGFLARGNAAAMPLPVNPHGDGALLAHAMRVPRT